MLIFLRFMLPIRRYSSPITEYRAGTGLKATSKNLGEYSKKNSCRDELQKQSTCTPHGLVTTLMKVTNVSRDILTVFRDSFLTPPKLSM